MTNTQKFEIDRIALNDLLSPIWNQAGLGDEEHDSALNDLVHEVADQMEDAMGRSLYRATLPNWDENFIAVEWEDGETVSSFFDTLEGFKARGIDERHLWTVLDVDGTLYIAAGWHRVNRVGYVVSEQPWTGDDERQEWAW